MQLLIGIQLLKSNDLHVVIQGSDWVVYDDYNLCIVHL